MIPAGGEPGALPHPNPQGEDADPVPVSPTALQSQHPRQAAPRRAQRGHRWLCSLPALQTHSPWVQTEVAEELSSALITPQEQNAQGHLCASHRGPRPPERSPTEPPARARTSSGAWLHSPVLCYPNEEAAAANTQAITLWSETKGPRCFTPGSSSSPDALQHTGAKSKRRKLISASTHQLPSWRLPAFPLGHNAHLDAQVAKRPTASWLV